MLVVLRGVPGSGKSTLARAIAARTGAVILDKDATRACLFPNDTVEYTTTQDDFVIGLLLEAARYHLQKRPHRAVLLDGRVFGVVSQVEVVRQFARNTATAFRVVECVCSRTTALQRIQADLASGSHPAKNRDERLLDAQLAKWEPLPFPVCRLDTERPLEECVERAVEFLSG